MQIQKRIWPHYDTALSLSLYHQVKRPYFIESIALTDSKRRYYRKSEEPFDPIYNFNLQFGKQSIFSHHDDASHSLSMQLCISVSKRNLGLGLLKNFIEKLRIAYLRNFELDRSLF